MRAPYERLAGGALHGLRLGMLHGHLNFEDTQTAEIYTLSLHDALPILTAPPEATENLQRAEPPSGNRLLPPAALEVLRDRKSTRLNSSHGYISYAVFCLKKRSR